MDDFGGEDEQPSASAAAVLATLQPVRDLAQNFDIDIATHLEEYLEQLADVLESSAQDGGELLSQEQHQRHHEMLDFAHAALLVQNSSQVYARKVDFFHALVMSSLEGLQQQQKRSSDNNRRGRRKNDAEDQAFLDVLRDPDWDFIPLDDIMPVAKHEDITRQRRRGRHRQDNRRQSTASLRTLDSIKHDDKFNNADSSSSSLPYRMPAYNTLNLVGNKCELTSGGALLLPGVKQPERHPHYRTSQDTRSSLRTSDGATTVPGTPQRSSLQSLGGGGDDNNFTMAIRTGVTTPSVGGDDMGGGFPQDDYDNYDHGDDDGGPGYEFADDNNNVNNENLRQKASAPGAAKPQKRVTFAHDDDPYELLDPHKPEGTFRPLRKGRTIVLPLGVSELPSDCVNGTRTKKAPKPAPPEALEQPILNRHASSKNGWGSSSMAVQVFRHIRQGTEMPPLPLDGLAFGEEFAYIAKRNQQKSQAERRKARNNIVDVGEGDFEVDRRDDGYVDNEDDGGGGFDDGVDDNYDFGGGDDASGGGGPDWGDDVDNTGNAGLATVEEVFQADENGGLTFEELCRVHIQNFAKGAEKYASETNLLTRVREWQEKLQPLLEAEEQREAFDIHKYCRVIIEAMQDELEAQQEGGVESSDQDSAQPLLVTFEAIVRNIPEVYIPRYFLACLSLCNSGNINLHPIRNGNSGNITLGSIGEDLAMELLSPEVEQPMDSYFAPSVLEKKSV